ncbi:MAG: T9SS type A sorting domain-containing protein [Chitinophagales bacterium]|nr:T9SS type A sorting domain-containing protein [Chitinophagales bacterium]
MKKIQILSFAYFLFFLLFTSVLFAQSTYKLDGSFEGLRKQYDPYQNYFMQEFQYQLDLKQNGNSVSGTSTIYSENGDYAEVKIRGMVVGDKFYFEEYEIVDEMKNPLSVWCFKSGELKIVSRDNRLYLLGDTKSYTSNFGTPCTGGYTEIFKTLENKESASKENPELSLIEVEAYPNPTSDFVELGFNLENKAKVNIEVYHINGTRVLSVLNENLFAGKQSQKIDMTALANGIYVLKLSIKDQVYSKQLIKLD